MFANVVVHLQKTNNMIHIQILGTGCYLCNKLEDMCQSIVARKQLDARIEKVADLESITGLGVLLTPGLVINGQLMTSGKVPTENTLERWLQKAAQEL